MDRRKKEKSGLNVIPVSEKNRVNQFLMYFQKIEKLADELFSSGKRKNHMAIYRDFLYSDAGEVIGAAIVYRVQATEWMAQDKYITLFMDTKQSDQRLLLDIVKPDKSFIWIDYFQQFNEFEELFFEISDDITAVLYPNGILHIKGSGVLQSREIYPWTKHHERIKGIVIEDGIVSIPDQAFQNHYALQFVFIPVTVETIGQAAFESCILLEEVIFPDRLQSIGTRAFCNCIALKNTSNLHKGISVEDAAFLGCAKLKNK